MLSVVEALQAVEAFELEERRIIPDHLKDTHPFSSNTIWDYMALGDLKDECEWCKQYAGQSFAGSQIRQMFPDYEWEGDDIRPNVHKTLWGTDTCKCLLVRVNLDVAHPEDIVFYSGSKVPSYTEDGYIVKGKVKTV
jgi:hypothetical protein